MSEEYRFFDDNQLLKYVHDEKTGKHALYNGTKSSHSYHTEHKDLQGQIKRFVRHLNTERTFIFISPEDKESLIELQLAFEGKQEIRLDDKVIRRWG